MATATPTTSQDGTAVALRVLSQRVLLSLIASFQRGPLGVVIPLLKRLGADGFVRCHVHWHGSRWTPRRESHRIFTPINANIHPQNAWVECVIPEAIARYDSQDFHGLRTVLAAAVFTAKPARAMRRLLHRTTEAAAACGRVDMLRWLQEHHDVFGRDPKLVSFCVKLATRHGQSTVLDWLETTFSSVALEPLHHYVVQDVVQRGYLQVIRWLADRKLGVMPAGAAFIAVAQRDVEILREVLTFPRQATSPSSSKNPVTRLESFHSMALTKVALHLKQPEAVRCILQLGGAFPIDILNTVISRRDLDTFQCMLDNLHSAQLEAYGDGKPAEWIVCRLVRDDDAQMLELVARVENHEVLQKKLGPTMLMWTQNRNASDAVLRLLLRMSPMGDIAAAFMQHATRGETARAQKILALVDRALPPDVLGFVHRVTAGTLGPLASLACTYRTWNSDGNRNLDAHLESTMAHWVETSTTQQDARDLVLYLVNVVPETSRDPFERVLAADADRVDDNAPHFDEPFLGMCRSLRQCTYYTEHQGIVWALRQRELRQHSAA